MSYFDGYQKMNSNDFRSPFEWNDRNNRKTRKSESSDNISVPEHSSFQPNKRTKTNYESYIANGNLYNYFTSSVGVFPLLGTLKTVIPILAEVLTSLVAENDNAKYEIHPNVSRFQSVFPPSISITDFLYRVVHYIPCSVQVFTLALIYLDRIMQCRPDFALTTFNIHRLLLTSLLVASKFFDDTYYNNAHFASVGGVSSEEMNALELDFLFLANFSLWVTADIFFEYHSQLIMSHKKDFSSSNSSSTSSMSTSPILNGFSSRTIIPIKVPHSPGFVPSNWMASQKMDDLQVNDFINYNTAFSSSTSPTLAFGDGFRSSFSSPGAVVPSSNVPSPNDLFFQSKSMVSPTSSQDLGEASSILKNAWLSLVQEELRSNGRNLTLLVDAEKLYEAELNKAGGIDGYVLERTVRSFVKNNRWCSTSLISRAKLVQNQLLFGSV